MDSMVTAALISAGAALVGVGGTVAVAVTSARNARQTNQATINAAHADALLTLEAGREAQFADRYSRALEQIGHEQLHVRMGGIYALEGIALDSARHHPTVMEVLSAFIRQATARHTQSPYADVQAVLTDIGRRNSEHDIRPIDLSSTHLRGANLSNAKLSTSVAGGQ